MLQGSGKNPQELSQIEELVNWAMSSLESSSSEVMKGIFANEEI